MAKLLTIEKNASNGKSDANMPNHSLTALMEALRGEVVEGFLDSHARTNKNAGKGLEIVIRDNLA